jgi:hypothetical protein
VLDPHLVNLVAVIANSGSSDTVLIRCGSEVFYVLEVLDERERLVEPMEQFAPLLIVGGASESGGVVFKTIPFDQQQEHVWSLDAP